MTAKPIDNIRNFSIVAHIDHGKSTLADRLIQLTGGLSEREMPGREQVRKQVEGVIGLDASNAIEISAKTGQNVTEVLEAIVLRLPRPKGDRDAPLKALLVDSWYDLYLGVVVLLLIVDGNIKKHQRIK